MASDLIQRAAAICGYPFTPSSDQLAAWLSARGAFVRIQSDSVDGETPSGYDIDAWVPKMGRHTENDYLEGASLLECLAAAVVEVDRIEREAKQP